MSRYFFTVRSPQGAIVDERGCVLTDEADARKYAARIIKGLTEDPDFIGRGFELLVRDDVGKELFVVSFDSPLLH